MYKYKIKRDCIYKKECKKVRYIKQKSKKKNL